MRDIFVAIDLTGIAHVLAYDRWLVVNIYKISTAFGLELVI